LLIGGGADPTGWTAPPSPRGDGNYRKDRGCINIHTEAFTIAEVDKLRDILLNKFDIHSTKNIHKPGYIIRISKKEIGKVQTLVKDIMLPSMQYRVGLPLTYSPDSTHNDFLTCFLRFFLFL
jgi:hypothetical protein